MENVGAVTFNDLYLYKGDVSLEKISRRAQTITHELAHMWFGNLGNFPYNFYILTISYNGLVGGPLVK